MELKVKINAADFRSRHGFNSSEPINLGALLQRLDILTLFKPLSNDFSGLSIKSGHNHFVLVNCNHSLGRQNFTIGHELYHLFYDREFTPHKCQTGLFPSKNSSEKMADLFASHLLLPEEGILSLIPESELVKDHVTLSTLLKIEQTYGSSRLALLHRLESLGVASKAYVSANSVHVKSGAHRYGYSTELYEPTPEKALLGSYGALANKLYQNDLISEGHYLEMMLAIGIDVNEMLTDEDD